MSGPRKAVHVSIEGRVQGVWYRGWTARVAGRLGLDGWVRNLPDGSVEAVFAGPADKVDVMIEQCRQGPPAASVKALYQEPWGEMVEAGFHRR